MTESPAMLLKSFDPEEGEEEVAIDNKKDTEDTPEQTENEIAQAKETPRYAVGILLSGEIEIIGDYTIFTFEEGARQLRAAVIPIKKGVTFSPATEQPPQ